jgi:membrane protease YdiL (CAAX protease family)
MNNDNLNPEDFNEEPDSTEETTETNTGLTPKISPVKAGLLGLAGGFFFYQIVGGLITLFIFGMEPENADINAFRLMTIAGQILFILLPARVFSKLIYDNVTDVIRFRLAAWKELGLVSLGIIALTPLLQNMLYVQNYFIEKWAKEFSWLNELKVFFDNINQSIESMYGNLLQVHNPLDAIIVIAAVSLTPAVCEEVMFRGFIQKSFELKFKPFFGALITAVFFGIYHFNPYALIPLIGLGFFFGYAAYKSNSILVPIVLHFINNFAAIILYFIFGSDELIQNKSITDGELTNALFNIFYQSILFIIVLVLIIVYYRKKKTEENTAVSNTG